MTTQTATNNCYVSGIAMAGRSGDMIYPAHLDFADDDTWNGFVIPTFDQTVAGWIADDLNNEHPYLDDDEGYNCTWIGNTLHMVERGEDGEAWAFDFDTTPRAAIGGACWTWTLVCTNCRTTLDPSSDTPYCDNCRRSSERARQ